MKARLQLSFIRLTAVLAALGFACLLTVKVSGWSNAEDTYTREWTRESVLEGVAFFIKSAGARRSSGHLEESADSLLRAGELSTILNQKDNAERYFNEACLMAKKGNYRRGSIRCLAELSLAELIKGNFPASKRYIDAAHQIAGDEEDDALLFARAEYLYYQRDSKSSIALLRRAIDIARSGGNLHLESKYMRSLGYALLVVEDGEAAIESFGRSLALAEHIGDKRQITFGQIALGFAYSNYRSNLEALRSYEAAESSFPDEVDAIEKASLYNGLGRIYEDFGDWKQSLEYRKKALELFQNNDDRLGVTNTLPSIAVLSARINPEDVEGNKERFAFAYQKAKGSSDHHQGAVVLFELGNYLSRGHDLNGALRAYENAMKYFSTVNDVRKIAAIKAGQAKIDATMGRFSDAREKVLSALLITREIKDRFGEAQNLASIAKIEHATGDHSNALRFITESLALTETLYSDVPNAGLQRSFLSEAYERYELLIELLMRDSMDECRTDCLRALQLAERVRARTLSETLQFINVYDHRKDGPSSENEIRRQLSANADLLERSDDEAKVGVDAEKIQSRIADLERELDKILARKKLDNAEVAYIWDRPEFEMEWFSRNFENTVLLEFAQGSKGSFLWVLDQGRLTASQLPPREVIETQIERLRRTIPLKWEDRDRPNEYQNEAKELSKMLLGSVADKLTGKRLIVIADGRLQYFPIGALPWPGPNSNEPILASNEVVYAPSASVLQLIRSLAPREDPKRDLLVFSDPVFSPDDTRLTERDVEPGPMDSSLGMLRSGRSLDRLARLLESEAEGKAIAQTVGGFATDIRSGFNANRETVLNAELSNYRMLHFATHGLIEETRPESSGIVLSLYSETGQKNDGGFIRIQDVYGMRLNSDLVVLSACETGIGKDVRGEGLMSLTNAFLQAGSKTVVSSLWKVDDAATKELMTEFYRGLAEDGLTVSAALRQAQMKLYNDPRYSSPFYWAAFTVHGDPDRVPQLSMRHARYAPPAAAVLFLLLGLYLLRVFGMVRRQSF